MIEKPNSSAFLMAGRINLQKGSGLFINYGGHTMFIKKVITAGILVCVLLCSPLNKSTAQNYPIINDRAGHTISFGNNKIKLTLNYHQKASITSLVVNGQNVIADTAGIYTEIKTAAASYSTLRINEMPELNVTDHIIRLSGISYGDTKLKIKETWIFTITNNDIKFIIDRSLSNPALVEEVFLPVFNFTNINTWEGAYQGYGGLAWFYLFNEKLCTYGVHTNSSRFWNSKTGNGLKIAVEAPGNEVAMKYSRTQDDKLAYSIAVSRNEMLPRFDSGTNRKRFIRKRTDVWAPFILPAGKTSQSITLSYFDFNKEFGRGKFVGMNGTQVSAVLNTIARIGVIDAKHFGGNSWHTPYGPICLHEQYIAQLGLAINDNTYLQGYKECLNFYRDNAIKQDGRVWPRWAYNNVDIMPGQVTDKGFYEAQWGFLLDSNPDLVTNVAELFDQTGDLAWVKTHQQSCEKALDWIINRDSNDNGLVEMMTDNQQEKRGSDWIDIIWASYENAFVNAKLYHALVKWAIVERQLSNNSKAKQYEDFAAKLKTNFNKPTTQGGFWDEEKNCYVHWLDKNKTVHGRNMVTPVNFMAIAYGICDDDARRKTILDGIETQMQKEKLFFWPLTMSSYAEGEGNDWQFPFPNYENGDLFLSWGAVGVKAYAAYKPELALKYVRNVMSQHSIDGLAFQRYGRVKQDGLGDDILSGNSLSVVGLYQAIYGINPLFNRFYLKPHITTELAGTALTYNFRGQKLTVVLDINQYSVSNNRFKIISRKDFGFYAKGDELFYFDGSQATGSLKLKTATNSKLTLDIQEWDTDQLTWLQTSNEPVAKNLVYTINRLLPNTAYTIARNGKRLPAVISNASGAVMFHLNSSAITEKLVITKEK